MKKQSLFILLLIVVLSILPATYVAATASCSGTNPVDCTLSDAFSFLESAPSLLLGKIITATDSWHLSESLPSILIGLPSTALSDSFHFLDSQVSIVLGNVGGGVFTQTTQNQNNIVIATSTLGGKIISQLVMPMAFIMVVLYFATRLGVKELPMLIGLVVFVFGGLIYAKIIPTYMVVFPILFSGVIFSLLVSKWLGSRGATGE